MEITFFKKKQKPSVLLNNILWNKLVWLHLAGKTLSFTACCLEYLKKNLGILKENNLYLTLL